MDAGKSAVLVTGDLVLDHHIYEGRRHHYADGLNAGVRWKPCAGGAALVHELLASLLDGNSDWESCSAVKIPQTDAEFQAVDESQRAYAFWRPFPRNATPEKQFWRVSEAMGFGSAVPMAPCATWPHATCPEKPKIIVLSEGGMGFRQTDCCWDTLPFDSANWIVLKTAAPIAAGKLWDKLSTDGCGEKLVVVVAANELRKSEARLSSGLSWDETLESILNELRPGQALASLTQCRHLIITFESEGAVWIDMQSSKSDFQGSRVVHFVYDPSVVEGDHGHGVDGSAFGFLSCLTAAVAWQLTLQVDNPDLEAACEGGLCAMFDLRQKGHGPVLEEVTGFPVQRLKKAIERPARRYARARFEVDLGTGVADDWSLLRESLQSAGPAYELARLTALRGPIALENVPHLKIGKLLTVDRSEVESIRQLVQLMRRYEKHDAGKKPLSIGVFGPPGSGKSFAVKEIAFELCGADGWLEFNLSQFASPADLVGSFHQIRDKVLELQLQKRLPVVFFDEFDSQNYHWLQYLLAPMQDGKFQEGQVTHPIGKCIFIFAGGTSWTFETFGLLPKPASSGRVVDSDEANVEMKKAEREFRLAKGPDFKSRLDAFLNVVGPNQRQKSTIDSNRFEFQTDSTDIFFPIRRALMLRAELKCAPDAKLDIDEGVLHALLHAENYQHGSRSLSKLVQPFQPHVSGRLVRSLLPPMSQIDMHTKAAPFLDLCITAPRRALTPATEAGSAPLTANDPLDEAQIETLAPAVHNTYEQQGLRQGRLKKEEIITFEQLEAKDAFLAESNRAAARRMIRILDLVDLQLADGQNTEAERFDIGRLLEYRLELLAEAEHDGWMKWHLEQGWRYAELPPDKKGKDRPNKLHSCLVTFKQLKHHDQERDRASIRKYLEFAQMAGKKIVTR